MKDGVAEWKRRLVRTWFSADPRSLGLLRIGLALLLLGDLLRRIPDLETWYTNAGLLPNHAQLWRPASEYMFSLFFLASHEGEAIFGFVLCGLAYLGLLVGWRTKLFQVLSLVAVVSLHSRVVLLENGGDVAMGLLAAWTLFLPLGRRFSVDALLASLRSRRESHPKELEARHWDPSRTAPVVSLAVFGVLVQLAAIYFFNAVHKTGPAWRDGSVVYWVLHQDRIVTWLGEALRDGLPLSVSKVFTWSTLLLEASAPFLLLTPFGTLTARRLAMVALPLMHLGFSAFLNLGFFTPTMITYFLILPAAADWEAWGRWWKKRKSTGPRTVFFDGSCGICFQVVRVLARLDAFHRLTFIDNAQRERLPEGVTPELVEETIVVVDAQGRQTLRSAAFAEIFRALPGWGLVAFVLRLPGLRRLADGAYAAFASNRRRISTSLGLAACGLPPSAAPVAPPEPPPAPIVAKLRGAIPWLREGAVLVFMLACTSQLLVENRAVPKWLRLPQPTVLEAIVHYGRFFQGWSMFAPNPPTSTGVLVVDAVTRDGRRIDPLNWAGIGWDGPPWESRPGRIGQDQFWCDYTARIQGSRHLHHLLEAWLKKHHLRTGRPEDELRSFDVYWIESWPPAYGEEKEARHRRSRILRYVADDEEGVVGR